jgi:hypothetical protein
MEYAHQETYKGYRIRIQQDDDTVHPYEDWDMFGTMYHWHRRGFFGEDYSHKQEELKMLLDTIIKDGGVVVPVWLYEHSGQTIRGGDVNPFSCPWDSGQVGFWAATREEVLDEFRGDNEKAKDRIKGEIETMDHYLRGEVYGFIIDKPESKSGQKDSCWGFVGDYNGEDGCLAEARSIVDGYEG